MSSCSACNRVFGSSQALHAHCRDKADHAYCEDCERLFVSWEALDQHIRASSLHNESDDDSSDEDEDEPFCRSCSRWFVNTESLHQHLTASPIHNWCFQCSRDFSSPTALSQHASSRVHAASDFFCPLCTRGFKQPSAIAHHVESGACPKAPVSRHQVTHAIHSLNIIPTISISRRIGGGPVSNIPTIVQYTATERAWNGKAYQCYLCYCTFHQLHFLNAHLHSAAHDSDEFRCPKAKCGRTFKVVSALVQHIESEACGLARFAQIEYHTKALTDQFARMLTFL
ncbi:hypothetical protein OF83DRAFT_881824 [Amylostereum chailletii]|nr:hypothetical protein OF83DRAFT_881824 [Amylostereum chailletii]